MTDGLSLHDTFIHEKVYKMRQEPDERYDECIGYSDAKIEKVEKNFNLCIGHDWLPDESYPQISIPDSPFEQLLLLRKRNSLFSESARRTLISLFIIKAIECADEDGKLFVQEEMSFSCVREEMRPDTSTMGQLTSQSDISLLIQSWNTTAFFCFSKLERLPN